MQDINRRVKNLYRLYIFLLGLAIFTGCWLFLLLTIPVLCRLYYLYRLRGVYVAPKLIENDNVKETFANIPELAKLGTDYLKELLKEKVKDDGQRDSNSTDNN